MMANARKLPPERDIQIALVKEPRTNKPVSNDEPSLCVESMKLLLSIELFFFKGPKSTRPETQTTSQHLCVLTS